MKQNDFYIHSKGNEYQFRSIALPLSVVHNKEELEFKGVARYHENDRDIKLFFHNGVWFVEDELPHVIYQSEKDYKTKKVWAREVDDFFGCKVTDGEHTKRFTLK